jgi:hypothetical protein
LLAAFALIESRHPAPLVPLRIFRRRTIVAANAVMLVFGTLPYGLSFTLTLYAQQVLGYSALKFGLTSLVFPVMAAAGSVLGQAIVLRVGFRPVAALGMALMGGGALLLTQVSVGGSYFGDIFFGLLVFGPGVGLAFVTASIAALAGVPEHESGLASGLSNVLPDRCCPRRRHRHHRRGLPHRRLSGREGQRQPVCRTDRGVPVGLHGRRDPRRDRRRPRARVPRPVADRT